MSSSDDKMKTIAERRGAFHAKITLAVAREGMFIQVVPGGYNGNVTFAYTIGLARKIGYDIITFGLNPVVSRALITIFYDWMVANGPMKLNHIYQGPENQWTRLPVLLRECDPENPKLFFDYAIGAAHYYGEEMKIAQLVLPDKQGRFPENPDFDHALMDKMQPLLYRR